VSLIFDRRIIRTTPGAWRTNVITEGVIPDQLLRQIQQAVFQCTGISR
jgi:hypothetical protein